MPTPLLPSGSSATITDTRYPGFLPPGGAVPTTVPTREVYWNIQGIWIMYALVVVMTIVFCYGAYRYYRLLSVGKPANRFDRPADRLKALLAHVVAQGRTVQRRYSGF